MTNPENEGLANMPSAASALGSGQTDSAYVITATEATFNVGRSDELLALADMVLAENRGLTPAETAKVLRIISDAINAAARIRW